MREVNIDRAIYLVDDETAGVVVELIVDGYMAAPMPPVISDELRERQVYAH